MSQLWVQDGGEWAVLPLDGAVFDLGVQPPARDELPAQEVPAACLKERVLLTETSVDGRPAWVVVSASGTGVRINGEPVATGIRVLSDRDEIRVGGLESLFFSSERLVQVEPHASPGQPISCPRCQQALVQGQASVRCPGCGVVHHQSEEFPCWTYSENCALCPQPTDLGAGFQWMPEDM